MEEDEPQVQSLSPDIIIARMSSRKTQLSPSREAKMSSPKLTQGTTLHQPARNHSKKSWVAQVQGDGGDKKPHSQEREMLALLG